MSSQGTRHEGLSVPFPWPIWVPGACSLLAAVTFRIEDVALLSKTNFKSKWCMGAPSFQIPAVVQMEEEQRFYIKEKKREKIDIY